jgi:hypothetical protein
MNLPPPPGGGGSGWGPGYLQPANLNLRDVVKIRSLREEDEAVTNRGRRNPGVLHRKVLARKTRFKDECGEDPRDVGVDWNGLEFALDSTERSQSLGADYRVFRTEHSNVELSQGHDRDCRLIRQAAERSPRLRGDKDRGVE